MLPCRWRPCPLRPGNGQVCGTNSIWRGETNTSELSSDLSCLTEGTQDPFGIPLGCWLPQTLLFQSLVSRGSCDHLASWWGTQSTWLWDCFVFSVPSWGLGAEILKQEESPSPCNTLPCPQPLPLNI